MKYQRERMIDKKRIIACRAEPAEPFVCGEMVTCTLVISVTEDISTNGRIRFHFTESPYYRIPPNYGLPAKGFVFFARLHFQTDNPGAVGYVTAETKSGQPVAIELAPGRCYFTIVCEGGLAAGETLVVTIGDTRAGSPGIEVAHHPTYGDWQLVCDLDREGDGNFVRQDLMPRMRVVAAPPSRVLVRTKSDAQPGVPADLQIAVTDRFGNHVENFRGTFRPIENGAYHTTRTEFSLEPKDIGSKCWQNAVVFDEEGIHRVNVESVDSQGDTSLRGVGHPVVCDSREDDYQLLWGDIHGHSYCTDGTHSPEFFYSYGRNVGYLDFCALTDHDTFSHEVWQGMMDSAEIAYDPGRFTTFLGYEWAGELSQSICVLFKNAVGGYYPGSEAASHYPQNLINLIKNEDAMIIRHDMPPPGSRWQKLDASDTLERLVEIYSPFHCSESAHSPAARGPLDDGNSIQAALGDGLRFGFVGCSDSHISMPGRRQGVSKGSPGYRAGIYGLTAVYAAENTRDAVFDALLARRCYAATDRIYLDFQVNNEPMGSELRLREPRTIRVRAAGTAPFVHVEIIKNNGVVHSTAQDVLETEFEYVDKAEICPNDYYYLRITQEDGDMAWSSPVWVDPL